MLYEYFCKTCKCHLEIEHGIKEKPRRDCPVCNTRKSLKRLISGTGAFILKGDGWYKDGYDSKGTKETKV